jgi:hypothetical protein
MRTRLSPVLLLSSLIGCGFVPACPWVLAGEKSGSDKRTAKEVKEILAAIRSPKEKKADEKNQALARLKAYRYLAGVPYRDLVLDEEMNKTCQAGVKLCSLLGRMEHLPKNPGLPEDEFKLAFSGTSRSNLGFGYKTLADAVDGWMFDTTDGSETLVGHRRWCLNPSMQKTGFGHDGKFTALCILDQSRDNIPDFEFISYPGRDFMPLEFFHPQAAWSVTLNPKKYKTPAKDYKPQVFLADAAGAPKGEPLPLDIAKVDTLPFGIDNCLIFRPEKLKLAAGDRYVVILPDIESLAQKQLVTIKYVVEFVDQK